MIYFSILTEYECSFRYQSVERPSLSASQKRIVFQPHQISRTKSRTKILSETCWFVFTDFHFLSTGQTDVIWKFCTESVSPLNFFNLQLLHFIPGPWTSLLRERSRDDREKFTDVNYTEAFILLSQWHYSGEQVSNYSWLTNSLPTCWKL